MKRTTRKVRRKTRRITSNGLVRLFWNKGEVRLNDDGSVDGVVATNVHVHVEQMGEKHFWMSIDGKQRRRMVLHFIREKKGIRLAVEDDGFHSSHICEGFTSPNADGQRSKPVAGAG